MFGRIGMPELLLTLAIVLLIFGPSKLPALAKSLGQALNEFKKGSKEVSEKLDEIVKEPVQEIKEIVEEDETK